MHLSSLLLSLVSLLSWTTTALAQNQSQADAETLTTQTLMMLDPSGSTLIATVTLVNSAASSTPNPRTTSSGPSPATQVKAQASSPPETTSETPSIHTTVLQATRTESVYVPAASGSTTPNENGIDVAGGASGSSSSGFTLSQGGMIAVIVVVVCVAVFGVLSITLFILAKKRQWRVRESLKRASRRLTGRAVGPRPRGEVERRKRSGVVAGSRKAGPPGTPLVQQQQKGGKVSETEMRDLEKGAGAGDMGGRWLGKMRGNDWR